MVKQTKSILSNSLSTQRLFNTLIDYAGVFPPTQLPLEEAITNYANYINREDSWILGPFVFPASNLNKLDEHMYLFDSNRPLSLSALVRKSKNPAELIDFLAEDLQTIQKFREKYEGKVKINFLELPLPSLHLDEEDVNQIVTLIKKYHVTCYCELPVENNFNKNALDSCIKMIADTNQLRTKLRTGGIKKELIPNIETVTSFIHICKKYNVSMKFTAGLHHPIRMYRDEVNTKMHGFLNVFTAGLMAFQYDLEHNQIRNILSDENHRNFSFENDTFRWANLDISASDIKDLRNKFICSFGSCNFVGPINEFIELDIIEGGN